MEQHHNLQNVAMSSDAEAGPEASSERANPDDGPEPGPDPDEAPRLLPHNTYKTVGSWGRSRRRRRQDLGAYNTPGCPFGLHTILAIF